MRVASRGDDAARSVPRVAQANGTSAVARLAWATRLGSRAAAPTASAAGNGPICRPASVDEGEQQRQPQGARHPGREGAASAASVIPAAVAALRASTPGTMIGVLELNRSWLTRSVTPVSSSRSLHWRWKASSYVQPSCAADHRAWETAAAASASASTRALTWRIAADSTQAADAPAPRTSMTHWSLGP